jgi:hypothetical protein
MTLSDILKIAGWYQRHLLYETGGILSRKMTLPFASSFEKPWVLFECTADPRYSFRCHELRLGPEGNPEAIRFDKKTVGFQGYVGRLYPTRGSLRGYVSGNDIRGKIGVHVRGGEAIECLSNEQIMNGLYDLLAAGIWTAKQKLEQKNWDERQIAREVCGGEKKE